MEHVPFVLSGGGARGFAHLGVVEACAEAGIVPSAISATSAGALLGAFIAAGMDASEVDALIRRHVPGVFNPWRVLRGDRLTQQRLRTFLTEALPVKRFEDLHIPFYVSVTDLHTGLQHILHEGDLVPALLAASAVPVVFPPVAIGDGLYVDGGLSNNLPIEPFHHRRAEVIAVYVNPLPPYNPRSSIRATLDRTVHLSFREVVARSALGCRLFIEPPALSAFGMFDLHQADRIRTIAHKYTRELLASR